MPALPDDDWTRLCDLLYALHSADTPEEARHHLQRSLPAVLRQPCHLETGVGLDGRSGSNGSDLVEGKESRRRIGDCVLALDREPDERAVRVLDLLVPHLELVCRRLKRYGPPRDPQGRRLRLTRRQEQVLALLLEGGSNAEIAYELEISARTVEKHVASLMRACGVGSRVQLIAAYHGNGLSRADKPNEA